MQIKRSAKKYLTYLSDHFPAVVLTGSQMVRLMKDVSDLHAGQGCGGPGGETTKH